MNIDDRLDRATLIQRLIRDLVSDGEPKPAARFVALVGPWGSGKSWLVDAVRPPLGGVTRSFNPWLFSDEIGLFRGYGALLLNEVKDRRFKRRLARALEFIGPSVKALSFDASGSVKEAAKALRGFEDPEKIRTSLAKVFAKQVGPTYILIDDLDRLTPSELLLFFKLVRLIGDVPGIVYLLVYDEDVLLQSMAQTEIASGSLIRARQYLEKVVETTITVPRLTGDQVEKLLVQPLLDFGRATHQLFATSETLQSEFAWRIQSFIGRQATTLRFIERFLDSVRSWTLHGEVSFLDWCLISYVRVTHPGAWRTIVDHPEVFVGSGFNVSMRMLIGDKKIRTRQVAVALTQSMPPFEAEDLLDVLDFLFPVFAANRVENSNLTPYSDPTGQRIGDSSYFERYFRHQLPADEVPDMQVRSLLTGLADTSSAKTAKRELVEVFRGAPSATIVTMSRRWPKSAEPAAVFPVLEQFHALAATRPDWVDDGLHVTYRVRSLAMDVLRAASEDELEMLQLPERGPVSPLTAFVIVEQRSPFGAKYYTEWVDKQRAALRERARLELIQSSSPLGPDGRPDVWLVWLCDLNMDDATEMLRSKVAAGEWNAADAVGSAVDFYRVAANASPQLDQLRVAGWFRSNDHLVELVRNAVVEPYPSEWDTSGGILNGDTLDLRMLGSYALTHWDAVARPD